MAPPASADLGISKAPEGMSQLKPKYTVTTLDMRMDLKPAVVALCEGITSARPGVNSDFGWPIYLYKGPGGQNFFDVIFGYPEYQTLVIAHNPATAADGADGPAAGAALNGGEVLAAVGYAAPCMWDGETVEDLPPGWDHVILTAKKALADPGSVPPFTSMSALAVEVRPEFQGGGLSKMVLSNMKDIAIRRGARGLLAPIRPILKPQYPLLDMEDYIKWRLPDPKKPGEEMMFDPWLRTHIRLGARILKVARESCTVTGSLADWTDWTRMHFQTGGAYTLPGGLVLLHVDTAADVGTYKEDNVWVAHDLRGPEAKPAAEQPEATNGEVAALGAGGEEEVAAKRQRREEP